MSQRTDEMNDEVIGLIAEEILSSLEDGDEVFAADLTLDIIRALNEAGFAIVKDN